MQRWLYTLRKRGLNRQYLHCRLQTNDAVRKCTTVKLYMVDVKRRRDAKLD